MADDQLDDYREFGGDPFESAEERSMFRFQAEDRMNLKLAHLGHDMNEFQMNAAGKHLIDTAIDTVHTSLMMLLDCDLSSPEARNLQIRALSAKLLVDTVIETLNAGKKSAFDLAEQMADEFDNREIE